MLYQDQQENSEVRSDGESRATRADKEIDKNLKIGSLRLPKNKKELAQTNKLTEPSRLDPQDYPLIMSVHTDKGNKGTRKIRSLETVRIEHRKRKAVYVRKDAQSAQKPYTYAKAAQLAQNISSIYVKNIRTPYAQAVHKRTKNPYTYAKAVHKRTQIRISYAKPHTFAQTVCRSLL